MWIKPPINKAYGSEPHRGLIDGKALRDRGNDPPEQRLAGIQRDRLL